MQRNEVILVCPNVISLETVAEEGYPLPRQILFDPVVKFNPALGPIHVLLPPVVISLPAPIPSKTLPSPVVIASPETSPIARLPVAIEV